MKTLILASALPLFVSLAAAQDKPFPEPAKDAPAETVRKATPAAWLGVQMLENDGKVTIGQVVSDSPAAKAGLQDGDIVLRIGDRAVEGDASRVVANVGERKPGETIALLIQRGDKEETLKVQLAERPAPEGEFRGEFRRKEKAQEKTGPEKFLREKPEPEKFQKEKVKDKVKEADKGVERIKDQIEMFEEQLKLARAKLEKLEGLKLKNEHFLQPYQFEYSPDTPYLQLGKLPWKYDGRNLESWLLMGQPDKNAEEAVWKRVEESVGRALKESGLGPDVIEKVMGAVKQARTNGPEQEARRAKLKAEAASIEKEMQALKQKADKVREELKKSGE